MRPAFDSAMSAAPRDPVLRRIHFRFGTDRVAGRSPVAHLAVGPPGRGAIEPVLPSAGSPGAGRARVSAQRHDLSDVLVQPFGPFVQRVAHPPSTGRLPGMMAW